MSRANVQSICIMAAMKSGLVTVVQDYPSISPAMRDSIVKIDNMLTDAIVAWDENAKDNSRAIRCLRAWNDHLVFDGLNSENNIITMVAMSQQSCCDLISAIRNKRKLELLTPIAEELDELGGYLHEGLKDKYLIPKFELADKILNILYEELGFENGRVTE